MTPSQSDAPLVAIVTPVYNGAAYLAETMDAVQRQTHANIVHIVLDNASTDATPAILARYANGRVPVRVTRNPALLPLVDNWNAAVALVPAEARYFRTLSADDLIAPEFVERCVELARRRPEAGVIATLYHENSGPAVKPRWPGAEVVNGPETIARYFRRQAWLPSAHVLYPRAELDRHAPFFDGRVVAFDLDAVMRILERADLGIVHEDLAMTRLHDATITNQAWSKEMRHIAEFLYFMRRYGPAGLGEAETARMARLYKRRYFRKMLKWRFTDPLAFEAQMKALSGLGMRPHVGDFVSGVWDLAMVKARLREGWKGFPLADDLYWTPP